MPVIVPPKRSYVRTLESSSGPMTLGEVKSHLKVTHTSEDALITSLILVVRAQCEQFTGRSILNQTWQLFLDRWSVSSNNLWWDGIRDAPLSVLAGEGDVLKLHYPPLLSVTHIKTYDDADVSTTFDAANYFVDLPGNRIVLRSGISPPLGTRTANAIEVEFKSGYSQSSAVPQPLEQGMLVLLAHLWENRGDEALKVGTISTNTQVPLDIPQSVKWLWRPYQVIEI